jgi:hypothetical protein
MIEYVGQLPVGGPYLELKVIVARVFNAMDHTD